MYMFIHAQRLGVGRMTDTIGWLIQNKIVNKLTTFYKCDSAE
jgi:hypothetical protein